MYGYNAEPPIAIPIYTVLPYYVINTSNIPLSLIIPHVYIGIHIIDMDVHVPWFWTWLFSTFSMAEATVVL